MKKLMLMILASGFVTVAAHADVGRNSTPPNCSQVIQNIQDALKRNRPIGPNGIELPNQPAPNSGTAQ